MEFINNAFNAITPISTAALTERGVFRGIPSLSTMDIPDGPDQSAPVLAQTAQKLILQCFRDIKELEASVINLQNFKYDGVEDEDGWSEDDHIQWKMNIQMAAMMAQSAQNKWKRIGRLIETEKRAINA